MRDISLLRKEDERRADIVSEFMDNVVYINENGFTNYERVTDRARQVNGIDVIFDREGKHYICDEKAAIRYINKNLQTFSFELSFINRNGEVQEGWLLSDRNINNSYMCIWIDNAYPDNLPNTNSIKTIQCSLVTKESILRYLEDCKFNKRQLMHKCEKIRENPYENHGNIKKYGVKFSFSKQLVEKPINVLIPREKLTLIADYTFIL